MLRLHQALDGDADIYLLHQRGSGQSSRLTCVRDLNTASDVAACADDLRDLYGSNLAAFSITSAALDLGAIITQVHSDFNSSAFVYGLGSGTLVVERLLHLDVQEIAGYVLDGSATTSGGAASDFAYESEDDERFGQVAAAFLELCDTSTNCSSHFADTTVTKMLDQVLAKLDDDDSGDCGSSLWAGSSDAAVSEQPTSHRLRRTLATLFWNATTRALIPAMVYRMSRCVAKDQRVLSLAVRRITDLQSTLDYQHELVHDLTMVSELWEEPPANQEKMLMRFTQQSISPGNGYTQLRRYCLFAHDLSTTCTALNVSTTVTSSSSSEAATIYYERDQYWNTAADIPDVASVLLLHGEWDAQAPLENAEELENALKGSAKELLVFPATAHNVLANAMLDKASSCGIAILASYIVSDGDLSVYDSSCVRSVPGVSFQISEQLSMELFDSPDAFDGDSESDKDTSSHSSSSSSHSDEITPTAAVPASSASESNGYKTAFFVLLGLFVLVLAAILLFGYRWWKRKQLREEEAKLKCLQGEEENDLELLHDIWYTSPMAMNYKSNHLQL